jgi:hypothetical protein
MSRISHHRRQMGGRGDRRGGAYRASAAAPFDPLTQSPFEWLRDEWTLNTGKIATWTDKSGNGRNYTHATAGKRPDPGTLDGQPAAVFTAASGTTLIGPAGSGAAAHVFIVLSIDADPPASGNGGLWETGTDASDTHWPFSDGVIYDDFGTTVRKTVGNPGPALTSVRLYEVITTASEWTARLDGAQIFTTATNTVGWAASSAIGGAVSDASGTRMNGKIAERLWFSTKRTAPQLAELYGYFEARYPSLVLP